MTIAFLPPIYDQLGSAADYAGLSPAHKMSVYWHGTVERHLPSILEHGLDASRCNFKEHICLATKAHVAHFYSRINAGYETTKDRVVLIKIPGYILDDDKLCLETGGLTNGFYGQKLPQRHDFRLPTFMEKMLGHNPMAGITWQEFQARTDTIGYNGIIKITEDMLDTRAITLHDSFPLVRDFNNLVAEYCSGVPNYDVPAESAKAA